MRESKANGKGEWRELMTVSARDIPWLRFTSLCPAMQLTIAQFGDQFSFSHTPGVMTPENSFRPMRHLHHRNIKTYIELMNLSLAAVDVVKRTGTKDVLFYGAGSLKPLLLKAWIEEFSPLRQEGGQPPGYPSQKPQLVRRGDDGKRQKKKEKGWGASLGEIVAQVERQRGGGKEEAS